jgi:hypothetical protein
MKKWVNRTITFAAWAAVPVAAAAALVLWLVSFRAQRTYCFAESVPPPAEAAPLFGNPVEWRYQWAVAFGGGSLQLLRSHKGVDHAWPVGWNDQAGPIELSTTGQLAGATDVHLLGFRFFNCPRHYSSAGGVQYWTFGFRYLTVPGWFPVLMLGLPSTLWLFRRFRRHRRVRAGRCLVCGYDLRATPDKCPECGTVPQHPVANGPAARHDRQASIFNREFACSSPTQAQFVAEN